MKLTSVSVKNYRSYFGNNGSTRGETLRVGSGLNLLVGPNNCGKSNLLRAIALALDPADRNSFNPDVDVPSQASRAYPTITLSFSCDPTIPVERTLLKLVGKYEEDTGATNPYAKAGDIHFRVAYSSNHAPEGGFLVRGAGARRGKPEMLNKALKQFKKCIRFIYVKSGESLGNFLVSTFRELLHTVLRDHLSEHMDKAERHRQDYLNGVVEDLLRPLESHTFNHLRELMGELTAVSIRPHALTLTETLAQSDIWLTDTAETSLLNKGTGIRGALLVALLSCLAQHSKRSLILAVEEPESFLHPGAQNELRSDLVQLAKREDLTLLVTTHSPFLIERSASTCITAFTKYPDGHTQISDPVRGNERLTPVIGSLFADTLMPNMLDLIEPITAAAKGVLFVEGHGDLFYLTRSAKIAQRPDLLDGLEIRHDAGAYKSALQALLLRQMVGRDFPIACLFDWDAIGKEAQRLLTTKYGWDGKLAMTYRNWRKMDPSEAPVEAEDMFPAGFMSAFVAEHGSKALEESNRYKDGTYHYGLSQPGKVISLEHIDKKLKPSHVGTFLEILQEVRSRLGL
ncbi:MAG: ATP-dependent endonuclease [Isosphaerales bacterium]